MPGNMCQTPLMRDVSECRGDCLDESPFPVTHCANGKLVFRELCFQCVKIPAPRCIRFVEGIAPLEVLFVGDIAVYEEYSVVMEPFSISTVHPGIRGTAAARRESSPYFLRRQRTNEKWRKLSDQGPSGNIVPLGECRP